MTDRVSGCVRNGSRKADFRGGPGVARRPPSGCRPTNWRCCCRPAIRRWPRGLPPGVGWTGAVSKKAGSSYKSVRRARCVFRLLGYPQDREGPGGNQALSAVWPLNSTLGSGSPHACVALSFGPARKSCDARVRGAEPVENPCHEFPSRPVASNARNAARSMGGEPGDSQQHVRESRITGHLW